MDKAKVENMCNELSRRDYGEIVKYSEFETVLGAMRDTSSYKTAISKVKKIMLEKGRALENVRGVGYCIIEPDKYSEVAINQFKLGFNRLDMGSKLLKYAPKDKMSNEALVNYRSVTDRAAQLHASLSNGIVELKLLERNKAHPLLQQSQTF